MLGRLIYYDIYYYDKTQLANFRGKPPFQATQQRLNCTYTVTKIRCRILICFWLSCFVVLFLVFSVWKNCLKVTKRPFNGDKWKRTYPVVVVVHSMPGVFGRMLAWQPAGWCCLPQQNKQIQPPSHQPNRRKTNMSDEIWQYWNQLRDDAIHLQSWHHVAGHKPVSWQSGQRCRGVLPPVWNLRAVVWFQFLISFFVLLSSPFSADDPYSTLFTQWSSVQKTVQKC